MVPSERALVSSYRPSMVTFLLSLRDVAAFVLQYASFSPPTSIVSPKFPHVPLGVGGSPFATKSEGVGLIVRAISFQPM